MILIVPLTAMNVRPPSTVFTRLLSMLLNALPTIADTVGNSNAEHNILDPDIGVDVSFCSVNDDEFATDLRNRFAVSFTFSQKQKYRLTVHSKILFLNI